ncbi:hypothetical protein BLNAU_9014 [Blattamonas nauphoetae]|uniref:ISXO2-like transposase domain-containing protein n=1 Tax=Blattamonas nauphoetae TaxID=2049346 RepID=A0ABQ9XX39_9EUKA|nr:hypothetical protein BLNAU_9014 [Blattamonas nauphoetae]
MMAKVLTPNTRIGGPGTTVEMDKAAFARSKGVRGSSRHYYWIVGGYLTNQDKSQRQATFERVARRDKSTLYGLIQRFVLPGTTIVTDHWKGFLGLDELGYKLEKVNNKKNEWTNENGFTRNHVEAFWGRLRRSLPVSGVPRWHHVGYFYRQVYLEQV